MGGEPQIVVAGDTEFRRCALGRGCREANLDDVIEGRFVVAFGETQPDGRLLARLVYIQQRPRNVPPPPRGQMPDRA